MRKRRTGGIKALGIGLLATALATAAQAQEGETVVLDDVVVTATRLADSTGNVGSAVSVITSEDLARLQVSTVTEALRLVPGVNVVQQGGPGRQTTVFLRGHKADETRVLLNGSPLNSVTTGGFDFGTLSVTNIDRIEIVRGPQSALYGSDAMAGVINIITKHGGQGLQGSWSGAVGNRDFGRHELSLNGGNDVADFSFAFSQDRFGGFSAADAPSPADDDEWYGHTVSGRLGLDLPGEGRLDMQGYYSRSLSDIDAGPVTDDPNYETELKLSVLGATYAQPITDWYTQSLTLSVTDERLTGEDPDTGWNNWIVDTQTTLIGLKSDFTLFEGDTLTVGYEFEREDGDSPGNFAEVADQHAAYIQNHLAWGDNYTLTLGLRYDDHETFGDETTYRFAGSVRCPKVLTRVHASFGTGFKAPNFNDLYHPWGGNPDLLPERSEGFDIGIEQPLFGGVLMADVTYFHSKVEDFIEWQETAPFVWGPVNVPEATLAGVEASLELRPTEALSVGVSYTYVDHEDKTTGNRLQRRADNMLSVNANYTFANKTNLSLRALHVGDRFNDRENTIELDAYTRVDLAASYPLGERATIFGGVENLFDEDYEEVQGYNTPGRYAYGGVKLTF